MVDVLDEYGNAVAFIDAIESAVRGFEIKNVPELYAMIKNHVNWYQRRPNMFVSAFSVRKHAENWGRLRAGPVWMYEFDTSKLPANQLVFQASQFIDRFTDNEYLFLLRIPCGGLREITCLVDGESPRGMQVTRYYIALNSYQMTRNEFLVANSFYIEPLVHCFTPSPAR